MAICPIAGELGCKQKGVIHTVWAIELHFSEGSPPSDYPVTLGQGVGSYVGELCRACPQQAEWVVPITAGGTKLLLISTMLPDGGESDPCS